MKFATLLVLSITLSILSTEAHSKSSNGSRCTKDTNCKSGACYPGPGRWAGAPTSGRKYCINRKPQNCAWPKKHGFRYGQEVRKSRRIKGTKKVVQRDIYLCSNPNGKGVNGHFRAQFLYVGSVSTVRKKGKIPNGFPCGLAKNCKSGVCYKGPGKTNLCMAQNRACAIPGGNGVRYTGEYNWNGRHWYCRSGAGLVRDGTAKGRPDYWLGKTCSGVFAKVDCRGKWLPNVLNFIAKVCGKDAVNCATTLAVDNSGSAALECTKFCNTSKLLHKQYKKQAPRN